MQYVLTIHYSDLLDYMLQKIGHTCKQPKEFIISIKTNSKATQIVTKSALKNAILCQALLESQSLFRRR